MSRTVPTIYPCDVCKGWHYRGNKQFCRLDHLRRMEAKQRRLTHKA